MGATMIRIKCPICGKEFEKVGYEVTRQIKKNPNTQFYCGPVCATIGAHEKQKNPNVTKTCPVCGKLFVTKSGAKESTFCSRSCASAGSVTEARRNAGRKAAEINFTPETHTIQNMQYILKQREAWKYLLIKNVLDFLGIQYEFECIVGNYIYDLALFDKKLLVEFDGPDHNYDNNYAKNINAGVNYWNILRISVEPAQIINPSFLLQLYNVSIRQTICPIVFL